MSTTGLYQLLVDLGADKERAEKALITLACEDQVTTKIDLAKLESSLTLRMILVGGLVVGAIALIDKL